MLQGRCCVCLDVEVTVKQSSSGEITRRTKNGIESSQSVNLMKFIPPVKTFKQQYFIVKACIMVIFSVLTLRCNYIGAWLGRFLQIYIDYMFRLPNDATSNVSLSEMPKTSYIYFIIILCDILFTITTGF